MDNLYQSACLMLKDKYNYTNFSREDFNEIANDIIKTNGGGNGNDINRMILIKIKETYELLPPPTTLIDNDILNKKLRDYEQSRKLGIVVNNTSEPVVMSNSVTTPTITTPSIIYQNPINKSKTFIINSINRDWTNNNRNNRNNLKVSISINLKDNEIYPDCLCLSKEIRKITPYIIMVISDNVKSVTYTLICDKENEYWDIWRPSNNDCDSISLNNKNWNIILYDFMNNELNLGNDNVPIEKIANYEDSHFKLYLNKNNDISNGDLLKIKLYNGSIYDTKINVVNNEYIIPKGNLKIEDFITGTILNASKQLILIVKYMPK